MSSKKEIKVTAQGYLDIENELNYLRNEARPANIQAIKDARAQGDLSENADYDAARDEQAKIEARIKELEYTIENAVIIEGGSKDQVGLGSKVTIEYVGDDDTDEYEIVGSLEADPTNNKISDESPVGKALCGAKKGDVVTITSPNGSYEVKVIKIA